MKPWRCSHCCSSSTAHEAWKPSLQYLAMAAQWAVSAIANSYSRVVPFLRQQWRHACGPLSPCCSSVTDSLNLRCTVFDDGVCYGSAASACVRAECTLFSPINIRYGLRLVQYYTFCAIFLSYTYSCRLMDESIELRFTSAHYRPIFNVTSNHVDCLIDCGSWFKIRLIREAINVPETLNITIYRPIIYPLLYIEFLYKKLALVKRTDAMFFSKSVRFVCSSPV